MRDAWIAAINGADADAFASAVTDDAVWLPAGRSAVTTRDGIRAWLRTPFETYRYEYAVTEIRLRILGEWAVERADFETRTVDHDGHSGPVHRGTYTMIWRHTQQGWRIDRYIDHTG